MSAGTATLLQPRARARWEWLASAALLVAVAGALLTGLFTAYGLGDAQNLGADFRAAYLPAAELVADGRSPYPEDPGNPPAGFPHYIYPPQLALAITPLTRTSDDVAAVVAVLVSLAALLGALAVLGVRDVRCYAVVVIWAPGWNALEMANVSAVLALLVALVWRFRDRLWQPATALAVMISVKLFLWPLLVWAVATRRIALSGAAVLLGAALTLGSWAAIGFAGLRTFPEVLSETTKETSYSIEDLAAVLGLGSTASRITALLVGVPLLVLVARFARAGDDERSFFAAIGAALALSPIVWLHYLVLLAIPLAIARPRFSPLWLLPIVLWVCPRSGNGDGLETFLPAAVTAILLGLLLVRPRRAAEAVVAT